MSIEGEAKSLMNNEAFVKAIADCQQWHLNKAMTCGLKDDEGRRRHLQHAKDVNKIVGHLNALIVATKTGDEVDPDQFYAERAAKRWTAFLNP